MVKALLMLTAGVLLFHVAAPPFYRFPEAKPFEGPEWYDPCAGARGPWIKANFHAHGRRLRGLLDGETPVEVVRSSYLEMGYDVCGITNYQEIVPPRPGDDCYISAYEHGFGFGQQHQTVLGARSVAWVDFRSIRGCARSRR